MIGKCFFSPRTWRSAWPSSTRWIWSGSISSMDSPPSMISAAAGAGRGAAASGLVGALVDSIDVLLSSTSARFLADVHLALVVRDRVRQPVGARGGVHVAAGALVRRVADLVQLRFLLVAEVPGIRAARLEPARRRHVERVRDRALDRRQATAPLVDRRDRLEQPHRVRRPRIDEHLVDG